MKQAFSGRFRPLALGLLVAAAAAFASAACEQSGSMKPSTSNASDVQPCLGSPAPARWRHVVVLIFENKTYSQVIGSPDAPYITSLATDCGSSYAGVPGPGPRANWHDADYRVDGSLDGHYDSKPNYATYASGVSPSVHGLVNDAYSTTSGVDNIYNQLRAAGLSVKSYYDGPASPAPCATSNFSGAYHDAMRYFTDLGGHSADPTTFCNTHDVPLSTFASDLASGNLPAYAVILPTNDENMHNNSIASGDAWAEEFLTPLFKSETYRAGDVGVFFLWDEDTAIPNVLIAPSVVPGSKVPAPAGNPISHFSALRTWEQMLGLPLLGDAGKAPSLLPFFDGNAAAAQGTGS